MEVRITREGESALIEFGDESIASTHLTIGPSMLDMTDCDILDCYNDGVRAQEHLRPTYRFVAIEIPSGKPQIQYSAQCTQWTPRGDVLRCVIEDVANGGPIIHIDDQELSWERVRATSERSRRLGHAHQVRAGRLDPQGADDRSARTKGRRAMSSTTDPFHQYERLPVL
jgi:hypothetical protein